MPWDPDHYHQFQKERSAPFEDLFSLVQARPGLQVIDLGCGTGELTRELAERLPGSQVLGLDSSLEMLGRAERLARPGLQFKHGQIERLQGRWDLIFSHAALQWVEDHRSLIPRLLGLVRAGGQLAVQMPSNHSHPAHTLILETAATEPFQTALDGWVRHPPVLAIDEYARLLNDGGGQEITVLEKVYPHLLASADALAEWTSGTALVPYFERLPEALHAPFLEHYRQALRRLWPSGPVFYPFRRVLLAAMRP